MHISSDGFDLGILAILIVKPFSQSSFISELVSNRFFVALDQLATHASYGLTVSPNSILNAR